MKKTNNGFEIYIGDLKPEVEEELRKYLGDNGNFDIYPLATVYVQTEEEQATAMANSTLI